MSTTSNISSLGLSPSEERLSEQLNLAVSVILVSGLLIYMLGMGMAVDIPTFIHAFKKPKAAAIGLLCQLTINPLVLFGIVRAFGDNLTPPVQIAAILMSVSPGGNSSNFMVYLARGAIEVSVMMTIVSTLLAFATMPFYVWLTTSVIWPAAEGDQIQIPFLNVAGSAAAASGPTLVGMLLQRKIPDFDMRKKFTRFAVILQLFAILVSSCLYIADPVFRLVLSDLGMYPWVLAVCLNLTGLIVGYSTARLARLPRPYWRTVAYEVGAQNASIPLAIVTISFGAEAPFYVVFLICYTLTSVPANLALVVYWRYCNVVTDEELEAIKTHTSVSDTTAKSTTGKQLSGAEVNGFSPLENGDNSSDQN